MSDVNAGGAWGEPRPTTGSDDRSKDPKELAAGAAQAVKEEVATFAEEAKGKAAEKLDQHKATASQTLGDFANAIRKAGDELSNSDQSMATRVVRQAADSLEGLARSVSDKRPEELLEAVRDFGRRNPTAFIAGSVLAGVALGRFLKSSGSAASTSDYQPSTYGGGLGFVDPTAAGATSVGAPDPYVAAEGASTLPYEEGALGAGDPQGGADNEVDRSRFGAGS